MEKFHILFVCMGNICRSPAGESVMRHLIRKEGLEEQIICDSSGTISMHSGEPPDSRMISAGRQRGIPISGIARHTQKSDLEKFDLILAMDYDNLAYLKRLDSNNKYQHKIRLFCENCEKHANDEVPDPYYGGPKGFEKVLDLLEDGCSALLKEIKEKRK